MTDAEKFNETMARLLKLRADLFEEIRLQLEEDGHCKSTEGHFRVTFPHYFEERDAAGRAEGYAISLYCYVVGPSRMYEWSGKTFEEAIARAEADVRGWIAEAAKGRAEGRG